MRPFDHDMQRILGVTSYCPSPLYRRAEPSILGLELKGNEKNDEGIRRQISTYPKTIVDHCHSKLWVRIVCIFYLSVLLFLYL